MKKISLLNDTPSSWIKPYLGQLKSQLLKLGHEVDIYEKHHDLPKGDFAFFLGCTRIVKVEDLRKHKHNFVVHPSDLPQGKGFSPLAWQVLKDANQITFCLFEAVEELDAGNIYLKDIIELDGTELNDEIKNIQGNKTIEMCIKLVERFEDLIPIPQEGEESFYPKRTPKDSELNVNKSLKELFPLLRTVDNDRYPAYFKMRGQEYELKIYKRSSK